MKCAVIHFKKSHSIRVLCDDDRILHILQLNSFRIPMLMSMPMSMPMPMPLQIQVQIQISGRERL